MAKTQIADVVIPSNFEDYIWEAAIEQSAFFSSGIVAQVEDVQVPEAGQTVAMPFWDDIGNTEEDLSDSGSLTPAKITSDQQIARVQFTGKAFSINDLAKWIAGDDPVQNLANKLGDFWGGVMNYRLINTLEGLFGAASMAGHVLDISGLSAGAEIIGGDTFADALNKYGERKKLLTHVGMHSATHTKLAKDGLISTERDKDNNYDFEVFGGRRVVMDDAMPVATGTYTTYLFGTGSVGFARAAMGAEAFESDRDILAGDQTVTTRSRFVLHPKGARFLSASVAGAGPTRVELANAANWIAAYDLSHIPMVQFLHKIA